LNFFEKLATKLLDSYRRRKKTIGRIRPISCSHQNVDFVY